MPAGHDCAAGAGWCGVTAGCKIFSALMPSVRHALRCRFPKCRVLRCKRPCFAARKATFCRLKGHVLHGCFYVVDCQKVMKCVAVSCFAHRIHMKRHAFRACKHAARKQKATGMLSLPPLIVLNFKEKRRICYFLWLTVYTTFPSLSMRWSDRVVLSAHTSEKPVTPLQNCVPSTAFTFGRLSEPLVFTT